MTAITTGQMGDLVNARAPRLWGGRIMTSAGDGKRSINRSQTVLALRYAGIAPGVDAKNSRSSLGRGYARQLSEFSGLFPRIDANPREHR